MQIIRSGSRPGLLEGNVPGRSVNASRLERWLGRDEIERVSFAMRDWYGPPIALEGVPGKVFAHRGGDFRGELRAGYEASAKDRFEEICRRARRASRRMSMRQRLTFNAGFASLSDLIAEATANAKRREFLFLKVGSTGVAAATNTLWYVGNMPSAGANAGAAPGGTAWDDASTGAFPFTNPTGGDTQHFVFGAVSAGNALNTLLLCDRLHSTTKTMNSTATEAVTGDPTRYQSTTATNQDYIGGNALMIECRTALPATAHNWTTCLYDNQANASSTLPSVTGNASNIINRLDQPLSTWFCPLAAGDTGIRALTQMQCSALVASGAIDFTVFRPLVWMPCPLANVACNVDGINTAFNLVRIFDDACLSFLEVNKPSTTATNYTGTFTTVAG